MKTAQTPYFFTNIVTSAGKSQVDIPQDGAYLRTMKGWTPGETITINGVKVSSGDTLIVPGDVVISATALDNG